METFAKLRELIIADRSVRRFIEDKKIERETLEKIIELTRYCSSGRNLQPLRYKIIANKEECEKVFPLLAWAGYLTDWDGPEQGERPAAYLVQCIDKELASDCLCDDGLQLQAITLGARALGIGCCIIKAFNSPKLKEVLRLPEQMEPIYVLAMGYPAEFPEIEDFKGDIKYYRTEDGRHHVPKRGLEDLILP